MSSPVQLHVTEATFRRLAVRGLRSIDVAAVLEALAALEQEDQANYLKQREAQPPLFSKKGETK